MNVSLVIPGRNTADTIGACLDAAVLLLEGGRLTEIIFVDDGSTDATREVVAGYPVQCIPGPARGAGAARNLGWRAAGGDVIWFMDSDCVLEPEALDRLMRSLDDPRVGAVGGSLGNACPESLIACLVHEEIIDRHLRMPDRVDFLATANVVYRREALERVGGFDERFLKGQDAELAWRVRNAGYELAFEKSSRVGHHYYTRWLPYLRSQRQQGYWRVFMHLAHPGHGTANSYSNIVDHIQPPLAMLVLAALALAIIPAWWPYNLWVCAGLVVLLLVLQAPITWRLVKRTGQPRYLGFALMSFLRSFWRGVGMSFGTLAYLRRKRRRPAEDAVVKSEEHAR